MSAFVGSQKVNISIVQVRYQPIAWLSSLGLLSIAPVSGNYPLCVLIADMLIAVLFLKSLSFGIKRLTGIHYLALVWLLSELIGVAWGYLTNHNTHSPYPDILYNGGLCGPVHILTDQIASIAAFFAVSLSSTTKEKPSENWAFAAIIICAIFSGVFGMIEEIRNLLYGTADPRLQAVFTNPNLYGAFLCLVTPLMFAIGFDRERNKVWSYYSFFSTTLLAAATVLTQSRGAILGVLIGGIYVAAASWSNCPNKEEVQRKRRTIVLGLLSTSTILVIVVGAILFPHLLHQKRNVSDDQRYTVWRAAITLIAHNPILGYGVGSFPESMAKLNLTELNPNTQSGYPKTLSIHLHAHDLLLEAWVERGILGALAVIGLVVWIFSTALKTLQLSSRSQYVYLAAGCAGSLFAYLINSIADYTLWFAPVSVLFWVIIALFAQFSTPTLQTQESA